MSKLYERRKTILAGAKNHFDNPRAGKSLREVPVGAVTSWRCFQRISVSSKATNNEPGRAYVTLMLNHASSLVAAADIRLRVNQGAA